jgi:hypothetical protein
MNETQSAKDYLTSPISSEGLAFTNEFRAHPTFLQLVADLQIVEAGLLGIIANARCASMQGHTRFEKVKNDAGELALPLLRLLEKNHIMGTPAEQHLACTVLERIALLSPHVPVGALLRGGAGAGQRLIWGSILLDIKTLGLELTKEQFIQVSLLADEDITYEASRKNFERTAISSSPDSVLRHSVIERALLDYSKATTLSEEELVKKDFCPNCNKLIM